MSPWRPLCAALACAAWAAGCATGAPYERDLAATHRALDAGDPGAARAALEALLTEGRRSGPEAVLLGLELGTVSLGAGDLAAASAALATADPRLDVIDLSRDDAGEVASWLFADAARPYRSPPWEKLMVNVLGMASRLASGDRRGALVEARRFEVVARFFRDRGENPGPLLAVGELLAATAHRAVGREAVARRYESQASRRAPAWAAAVADGPGEARAAWAALAWPLGVAQMVEAELVRARSGELVVVALSGRVAAKVAQRVDTASAERLAAQPGAAQNLAELGVKELVLVGLAGAPAAEPPGIRLAGQPLPTLWADLGATARAAFAAARPAFARAAITRALSRQAVRRTVAAADGAPKPGARPGWGAVLGDLISGTMAATDTPDTRAWSTLPAHVGLARVRLPAGRYVVEVGARAVEVELTRGRPTVVLISDFASPAH